MYRIELSWRKYQLSAVKIQLVEMASLDGRCPAIRVGEELPYVLVPRNKRPKKMKGGGVSRNEKGSRPTSSLSPSIHPSHHHPSSPTT
jgi:hypothetical protein